MIGESRRDVVIRTPDQRLRVFVSSTMVELAEERRAALRAISALRLTPVVFELGARPHSPRELYRAYLAQSDVFIGLYWQQYGQSGPAMKVSGLEEEFDLSHNLPRLMYVKVPAPDRDPLPHQARSLLPEIRDGSRAGPVGARRPCDVAERALRSRAPHPGAGIELAAGSSAAAS